VSRIVGIIFICLISQQLIHAQNIVTDEIIRQGLDELRSGRTENASEIFRNTLARPEMAPFHPDALYWLVKTDIMLERHEEASAAADRYIIEYPYHNYYEEILYQRGRLLYLENEPDKAIVALGEFITEHPDSTFVSSAYYWAGEALLALGRLDEAAAVFVELLNLYPASVKREAARFRQNEISLMYRERELLDLLKWSHEEYLRDAEDFYRRESELLKVYKDISLSGQQEMNKGRLLEIKGRLLGLQEFYLNELLRLSDED
jgi:outer membrane protein assembly factor BamD (BamD/ComL family)